MKILLTTLNSKYIHSNLAIRYLKAVFSGKDVEVKEYTINDNASSIVSDIFLRQPDVAAFSCYIWNIEMTLKIVSSLKKAKPDIKIILGGPEVSYEPKEFLEKYPEVDFIIFGEGELTFRELMNSLETGDSEFSKIDGLAFRNRDEIVVNRERELIKELDIVDFPYKDELEGLAGKMVYYEASRGCPFNCQYCLSSTIHGVRYFSMDRVKSDLQKLINVGVSQVKFVDRTFNCHKKRTIEILEFLLQLNPQVNFHFEIAADILDDDIIGILSKAPEGLFQFEIGVQSTNQETLDIISRQTDFPKISEVVTRIICFENIHLHLDLIAGLPRENYARFGKSFDDVYNLKPQMLQLGFLKLLRGSGLRQRAGGYGIKFNDFAPYEVISTNDISYGELVKLKDVEEVLEKYYNSGRFAKTLDYVTSNLYNSPFVFYEEFSEYWRTNGYFEKSQGLKQHYSILLAFINERFNQYTLHINELLKYDFLSSEHSYHLPEGLVRIEPDNLREMVFSFLKETENVTKYLPQYEGIPAKQIIKSIHVEAFSKNVLDNKLPDTATLILFDYNIKIKTFRRSNVYDISKEFTI